MPHFDFNALMAEEDQAQEVTTNQEAVQPAAEAVEAAPQEAPVESAPATEAAPQAEPVGRKPKQEKKSAKASANKKKSARNSFTGLSQIPDGDKVTFGVYMAKNERKNLKNLCVDIEIPATEFVRKAVLESMYYTYTCIEPGCSFQFSCCISRDGDVPTPTICPVCGGNRIRKVY